MADEKDMKLEQNLPETQIATTPREETTVFEEKAVPAVNMSEDPTPQKKKQKKKYK